jgi:M6 family metalloprotease-like protein
LDEEDILKSWISLSLITVSAIALLPSRAFPMPPRKGIEIPSRAIEEMLKLGIDLPTNPVRDRGKGGIVNHPGDVTPLVTGAKGFPVVAINYPDYANTYSRAAFDSLLFGPWPLSGSAQDYYRQVSYNQFTLTGAVAGWYTANNSKSYYGYSNGFARAAALVKEAAQKSDASVNYVQYDNDGDGYVDVFTCIHAGYGTEETGSGSDIWSHKSSLSGSVGAYTTNDPDPNRPGQYIRIDTYTTDPERSNVANRGTMVGIGVYCHEWSHGLGLPDLYNTAGGSGNGEGLGDWSLMAAGSWGGDDNSTWAPAHLDPWSKMMLGWLNPTAVRYRNRYSLPQVETNDKAYWLVGRQRTFKEYFLVENRQRTGFDNTIWGPGLCIYHIDDSMIGARWNSNQVNAGGSGYKYGVALEQAHGTDDLWNGTNRGDAGDPFPGTSNRTTFDSTATTPNSRTNFPSSSQRVTSCLAKNIPPAAATVACTLASGLTGAFTGVDNAGNYRWIDSDTVGGPAFSWIDVVSTGTLLGTGDDNRYSLTLPFNFGFYGTSYNTVWVCTNGWLSFGADPGTSASANVSIPNTGAPNQAVFAYWDNLNLVTSDSSGIYYRISGSSPNQYCAVTWRNARITGARFTFANQITFQAILYEQGPIVLQYKDCAVGDTVYNWGRSATIGIENQGGTVGAQYLYNGSPNGNLMSNERAIRFYPNTSLTHDVGVTHLLAPAGTIDSGTSVAPACSVYNFGTGTEAYTVRMKVGTFYDNTAAVSGHNPSARLYVTFPASVVWRRGSQAVSCSTELAGDATPGNDKTTGSVTVRVLDAEALSIVAPAGTVDSGQAVTPQANVRNNGTGSATFDVRFDIGTWNNTQTVTLAAGASQLVSFGSWTAPGRGTISTKCSTRLTSDAKTANDRQTGTVTVQVRDVGTVAIMSPGSFADSGTVVTPACTVANFGTTTETYQVRMKIGAFYNNAVTISSQAPSARTYATFPAWSIQQPPNTYAVTCSTELAGDAVTSDDRRTSSVQVQRPSRHDVGCSHIVAPAGTIDSGTSVTPACSVYNYGNAAETYTVRMKVGSFYNNAVTVSSHNPSARLYVTFPASVVWRRGSQAVSCSTELAGDATPGNDKATGSVTVRVLDAEALSIVAPAGTVDSGQAVTPQANVRNNGTGSATFDVRFDIGTWNNTQTVTLAAGASQLVSFGSWTAPGRGTISAKCSTRLTSDAKTANDRQTGTVTVQVRDVGTVAIMSPGSFADSGTVVTPACTVANFGTTTETYQVRMKIGAFYNNAVTISSQAPSARTYATFPAWSIQQPPNSYAVSCSTELAGDGVAANNRRTSSVQVQRLATHDVACTRLITPSGTIDSATVIAPACSVYNFGNSAETYQVRMKIGAAYNQTAAVSGHASGAGIYVTFATPWTATGRGNVSVTCSTELAADMNRTNDRQTSVINLRVLDAEAVSIVAPTGTVDSGQAITPQANVQNNGTGTATFDVRFDIGTWNNTQTVTLAAGASQLVSFGSWTAPGRGTISTKCSTRLTSDAKTSNDRQTGTVTVQVRDVGTVVIMSPGSLADSGTVVTPACTVANFGTTTETYTVRMKIGVFYNNAVSVSSHASGARLYVTFPNWSIQQPPNSYAVSCSTELAGDGVAANNRRTSSVQVQRLATHDVACTRLITPSGTIDSATVIAPACSVYNFGNSAETYTVRMRIGSLYNTAVTVSSHGAGTARAVVFPDWTALPRGSCAVSCSTELALDMNRSNDRQSATAFVSVRDVGTAAIAAPSGTVDSGVTVTPACTLFNAGNSTESYQVRMSIGTGYNNTAGIVNHAPGDRIYVTLPAWTANQVGTLTVRCSTELAGDPVSANDPQTGSVTIRAPAAAGWFQKADVPSGPRGKRVRDGGSLAYAEAGPGDGVIYALKGNNTCEFYEYRIATNTWTTKDSVPPIGSSGKKKKVKKGASLTEAGGKLYATKGNNTVEFWQYASADGGWVQKADVPTGARNVKEGTGAVAVTLSDTTYVYFLKGSSTQEFYRYNTLSNAWETRASAPAGLSGKPFKNGSGLTYDGANTVYALKGSYDEFYVYQVDSNSWMTKTSLPLIGSSGRKKKAKDGAGVAYYGPGVYALKGGNTQEFWTYRADSDQWVQREDMPIGGGKRVKGGGALTAAVDALYATKGNNTLEFWQYIPANGLQLTADRPDNTMADLESRAAGFRLRISPNPFCGTATVSYTLPEPGAVRLALYDVTGKLVRVLSSGGRSSGEHAEPAIRSSELTPGVYVLKLETEVGVAARKVIIE